MARAEVFNYEDALPTESGAWYLCFFLHRLLDFRISDVESVVELLGNSVNQLRYLRLPSESLAQPLADRAMLTRGLMEVWGEGATWEELRASIESCPAALKEPWLREHLSFKVAIESYGCKLGQDRQLDLIEKLAFIPILGTVDLKKPDVKFWLIVCSTSSNGGIPDSVPDRMYFGREVALSDRSRVDNFALRRRAYIGPTSMDPEMAFIMANMGKVKSGQLVMDPYAGTGSVMVAAAAFGAQVVGTDIDIRVIRFGKVDAQGQPLDVYCNFQQYGLTPRLAGLARMDVHRHALRPGLEEVFHAIIGDPPYGVRAGGRKSAFKEVTIRDRDTYIPSTEPYSLGECLRDLLDLAARLLVVGGRLVYFFPAVPDVYEPSEVPGHPALELVANTEQLLTTRYSRRLVTMEKVRRYDAAAAAAHHAEQGEPLLSIDKLHDAVYESRGPDAPPAANGKKFRGKHV